MDVKTRGIVLHTTKYSETSVIAKIYTEKLGLLSFIVKGVRTARAKAKASMLQPLTLLNLELQYRENKQLQFIKEFSRAYSYQTIPFDVLKSTVALLLLEVITKAIREHEENLEMFDFIYESFCLLDKTEKLNPDFHLIFLMQFTRHLGFLPHNNHSVLSPYFELTEGVFVQSNEGANILPIAESELFNTLINATVFRIRQLKIGKEERRLLLKSLIRYYQLHLENFNLRSPEILGELLS